MEAQWRPPPGCSTSTPSFEFPSVRFRSFSLDIAIRGIEIGRLNGRLIAHPPPPLSLESFTPPPLFPVPPFFSPSSCRTGPETHLILSSLACVGISPAFCATSGLQFGARFVSAQARPHLDPSPPTQLYMIRLPEPIVIPRPRLVRRRRSSPGAVT